MGSSNLSPEPEKNAKETQVSLIFIHQIWSFFFSLHQVDAFLAFFHETDQKGSNFTRKFYLKKKKTPKNLNYD